MPYFIGVIIPTLLQCLAVFIIVVMNTGNGSFLGLATFLIGLIAIPVTTVINATYVRSRKDKPGLYLYTIPQCYVIALIAPFIITILLLIG